MIVVPLTGGPKLITVQNKDGYHPSFIDFDTDDGPARREILPPGHLQKFRITGKKYVSVTMPSNVKMISVEEA